VPYRFATLHLCLFVYAAVAGMLTPGRDQVHSRAAQPVNQTLHVRHLHNRACRRSWRCWADYVSSRRVQRKRQHVAALRCFGSLLQRSVRGWRQHVELLRRGKAARAQLLVRPQLRAPLFKMRITASVLRTVRNHSHPRCVGSSLTHLPRNAQPYLTLQSRIIADDASSSAVCRHVGAEQPAGPAAVVRRRARAAGPRRERRCAATKDRGRRAAGRLEGLASLAVRLPRHAAHVRGQPLRLLAAARR